jgi:hypothetical protein
VGASLADIGAENNQRRSQPNLKPIVPMNTAISTEQFLADLRNIARDAEQILSASPEAMGDKAGEVRKRLSKAMASRVRIDLQHPSGSSD